MLAGTFGLVFQLALRGIPRLDRFVVKLGGTSVMMDGILNSCHSYGASRASCLESVWQRHIQRNLLRLKKKLQDDVSGRVFLAGTLLNFEFPVVRFPRLHFRRAMRTRGR